MGHPRSLLRASDFRRPLWSQSPSRTASCFGLSGSDADVHAELPERRVDSRTGFKCACQQRLGDFGYGQLGRADVADDAQRASAKSPFDAAATPGRSSHELPFLLSVLRCQLASLYLAFSSRSHQLTIN